MHIPFPSQFPSECLGEVLDSSQPKRVRYEAAWALQGYAMGQTIGHDSQVNPAMMAPPVTPPETEEACCQKLATMFGVNAPTPPDGAMAYSFLDNINWEEAFEIFVRIIRLLSR